MKISKTRVLFLSFFLIISIICWNYPFIYPIKIFVVYLHEISHALATICTGGSVKGIYVSWSEVGATVAEEGIFFITALSGYLGSIFWGSLMFRSALTGYHIRIVSIVIGSIIILSTIFWVRNTTILIQIIFFGWGSVFLLIPTISISITRILLFFLGGMSALYSLYDLNDFFHGEILKTDAGIIATYYIQDPLIQKIVAYTIGIFISLLGIWIMSHLIYKALYVSTEQEVLEFDSQNSSEINMSTSEESDLWQEFQDWKEFKRIKKI